MNLNEIINKFQGVIAVALIIFVLIYGSYNFIYKPKLKEIRNLQNSLKLIDSEIKMIQGGELLLKDLDVAKAMLRSELDQLSKKIPPETDTPYLINNYISVVGKGLKIDYNLIQPGALAQEQRYKRLPLRVEFEGDYANLNNYLGQLKNLPVTIRVDNMELHKLSGTRKLAVRILLSAFVVPGGKEKPPAPPGEYKYLFDPFYTVRAKKTELKFEAVTGLKYIGYWMGKNMKAVINDEAVTTGDSVKGFKVLKIYKDRVILGKDNRLYELTIGGK